MKRVHLSKTLIISIHIIEFLTINKNTFEKKYFHNLNFKILLITLYEIENKIKNLKALRNVPLI
jgi:hypothetical protein